MKRALVTGSSGLVGSAAVAHFDRLGWRVHGIDNNLRRDFFGPDGDTARNLERLRRDTRQFEHLSLDVRDREAISAVVERVRPDLVVHCAAQPAHDLARARVFDDFDINAVGTLNRCPQRKAVQGDRHEIRLREKRRSSRHRRELPDRPLSP